MGSDDARKGIALPKKVGLSNLKIALNGWRFHHLFKQTQIRLNDIVLALTSCGDIRMAPLRLIQTIALVLHF